MSQQNFQNGKDYGYYTIDTRFNVNGTVVGAGASAIEAFIESLLGKGKGSVLMESLKFVIKKNITSSTITTSVEIGFNDQEVTVNGVIVDFAGGNATQALLSAIALALFGTNSLGLLPIIGLSAASGFVWSSVKNASLDLIDGSLTDLKFINSSGEHDLGILLPSESFEIFGGVKGAINAYLANTSENVDGGYLTFADGRDESQIIYEEIYKLFSASAFQVVANGLGISLSEFLSVGVGGVTNNDIYYANFNKVAFLQNTIDPSQSSKIYIPVGSQVIAVDAIISGSSFLLGRSPAVIFGTTQISYPDELIIGSGEYGASMIIRRGIVEGNLRGYDYALIGSNSGDLITFSKAELIDGLDGSDTVDYSDLGIFTQGITANLETGAVSNGFSLNHFSQTIYNIENIIGSDGDDVITGNSSSNIFTGGEGNDVLSGGGGEDKLYGGAGDDNINGGEDKDLIYGGAGDDSLDGGFGDDSLYGGADDDKIDGGNGNDFLSGGSGNDVLRGGFNDDELLGNDGDDKLDGESGNDVLLGGRGFDTYNFSSSFGVDTVNDSDQKYCIRNS